VRDIPATSVVSNGICENVTYHSMAERSLDLH